MALNNDQKNGSGQVEGCKCWMHDGTCCGMCSGCYGRWAHGAWIVRIILGLVILGIVFFVGVKLGEFKSEFMSMMGRNRGYYGRSYGGGGYGMPQPMSVPPMMTTRPTTGTTVPPATPTQ